MSLSPLAERIYQVLLSQLHLAEPRITYGDLVQALGPLPRPNSNLVANDRRLYNALEEIIVACQRHTPPLPVLTSIVVQRTPNGGLGVPGEGYFSRAFPHVRAETAKLRAWKNEVTRVVDCAYPPRLIGAGGIRPREPRQAPRWLREPAVIAAIITVVGSVLVVIVQALISARGAKQPEPAAANALPSRVVPAKLADEARPQPQSNPAELAAANPPAKKAAPTTWSLDEVLDALERHHQRATFGAVAGILGVEPLSLFKGRARTAKTSWVVSKATGLPTGTKEDDYPPRLLENKRVINSPEDLRRWLQEHY